MNKKLAIAAVLLTLVPFAAGAQSSVPNVSQQNLPQPVNDLLNTLSKININNTPGGSLNTAGGPPSSVNINGGDILNQLGNLWQSLNNWFAANTGVSLSDIIKAVVNLIIWIWEIIIKLLQVGLSHL